MAVQIPETLSPSKLSRFLQCPLSFRYSYIDHLPEPSTPAQLRGTLVHRALQLFYEDHSATERQEALALASLERAWSEMAPTEEMLSLEFDERATTTFVNEARALVRHYFAMEDPTTVSPIGIELDLTARLGEISLHGIIDRLDRLPSGETVVTDYKTGRSPRPDASRSRLLGVQFYAYLCQEVYGVRPSEIRLLYLKDQVVIVESPNDQTMRGLKARATAAWQAIERACDAEDFRPNVSALCRFCAFQDRCPAMTTGSPSK